MNQSVTIIKLSTVIFLILFLNIPILSQVINLIDENTPNKVLVPDTTVKTTWRYTGFKDTSWITGTGGVGYGTEYSRWIKTSVKDLMYHESGSPNRSCMLRIKFPVTSEQLTKARRLMLYLRYDDGFEMYINGYFITSYNAPYNPKFNSLATGVHNTGPDPEILNITPALGALFPGENLLVFQGFNISANDEDFLLDVKLTLETFGEAPVFESSNLPIIVIDTKGADFAYDKRINADMGVINNGPGQRNRISDAFNDYNGKISIEIRGSSSAQYYKKSYNIETQDSLGNNRNVSLLGHPKENDWILYGPYTDKSLMRDVLMYRISNLMGEYASRTRYCELILNNNYRGIYVLMEKIKQDKNRVNVSTMDIDDNKGDSLTGGYIIKIDKEGNAFFTSAYPPYPKAFQKISYQYHYPKDDLITEEQKQYIKSFIDKFETTMADSDYADPDSGYSKYIVEESFINHFLLNEISKNVDGYRISSFFYKDRDSKGGKLHAGPIWDLNFSLGDAGYYGADSTHGWELDELSLGNDIKSDGWLPPFWWEKLVHEKRFADKIITRWNSLRTGILEWTSLENLIDGMADTLREAQQRNFTIFSGPGDAGNGFWPIPYIFYTFNTYQDEIDYLKYWLHERINWVDQNILKLTGVNNYYSKTPSGYFLFQNYPNPFNPETNIIYQLTKNVHIELKVFDILGREVTTLVDKEQNAGRYKIKFSGNDFAGKLSSGIYLYRIKAGDFIKTNKMIFIK